MERTKAENIQKYCSIVASARSLIGLKMDLDALRAHILFFISLFSNSYSV